MFILDKTLLLDNLIYLPIKKSINFYIYHYNKSFAFYTILYLHFGISIYIDTSLKSEIEAYQVPNKTHYKLRRPVTLHR